MGRVMASNHREVASPSQRLWPVLVGPCCLSWMRAEVLSEHSEGMQGRLCVFMTSDVSLELVIFISLAAFAVGHILV